MFVILCGAKVAHKYPKKPQLNEHFGVVHMILIHTVLGVHENLKLKDIIVNDDG